MATGDDLDCILIGHNDIDFPSCRKNLSGISNVTYTFDTVEFHRTPRAVEDNSMDENAVDWSYFAPNSVSSTLRHRTNPLRLPAATT